MVCLVPCLVAAAAASSPGGAAKGGPAEAGAPAEAPQLRGLVARIAPSLRSHLVAHRGFHSPAFLAARPLEGTLAAFSAAWLAGIKLCECDVRLTADGKLVLSHDDCLRSLAELGAADAGAGIAASPLARLRGVALKGGERLALLEEALELACKVGGRMIVELKPGVGVGRAVASLLRARRDLRKACEVVMSFELGSILEFIHESTLGAPFCGAPLGKRPRALLLTVACPSGDPEYTDREQVLDLEDDESWPGAVDRWLQGGVDGVYVEWLPGLSAGGRSAAALRRLCATCPVGVWQYFGQPDCEEEALELLASGVRYINSDLPLDFCAESRTRDNPIAEFE